MNEAYAHGQNRRTGARDSFSALKIITNTSMLEGLSTYEPLWAPAICAVSERWSDDTEGLIMTTFGKSARATAVGLCVSMVFSAAFAQGMTRDEGASKGASDTGKPMAAGSSARSSGGTTSGAASTGAGTGESKTTATGGEPGGRADKN